jgi:hypothetical protein
MWIFFYYPIETYHLVNIHGSEEEEGRQWQVPLPMTMLMALL